jgi:type I restriction enzyme S subunit
VITDGTHKTPNYQDSGVRFISIANIRPFQPIDWNSYTRFVSLEEHKELTKRCKPERDDILFPRIGTLGYAKRIDFDEEVSIFVGLGLLKPDHQVVRPKYLELYMNTPWVAQWSRERANGSGRLTLPLEESREFSVLVAPLKEQDQIVTEVEKQFTRLDNAVAALKRVQANLKRYRASVLKAACEGRLVPTEAELARKEGRPYEPASELLKRILQERRAKWEADQLARMTAAGKPPKDDSWKKKYKEPDPPDTPNLPALPEGWAWARFGQLTLTIRSGTAETAMRSVTDYPVLRSSAVRPGVIDFRDLNYLRKEQSRKTDNYVQLGDVFVTRLSGSLEYVGVAAAVRSLPSQPIQYPDRLFCVRVLPGVSGQYFSHCFRHPLLRSSLDDAAKSSAGHQRIAISDLHSLCFPVPPFSEQQRIVSEIDRRLSVIDELDVELGMNVRRADSLRQSILKRAFEGKLVPQDPNDEPASVLLERIRAERVAKQTVGKPRGRTQTAAAGGV